MFQPFWSIVKFHHLLLLDEIFRCYFFGSAPHNGSLLDPQNRNRFIRYFSLWNVYFNEKRWKQEWISKLEWKMETMILEERENVFYLYFKILLNWYCSHFTLYHLFWVISHSEKWKHTTVAVVLAATHLFDCYTRRNAYPCVFTTVNRND